MKLAAIFSENMVLQRDKEVSVFGESTDREEISVSIDDISVKEVVDAGKWCIKLPPHPAGGPYTFKAFSRKLDKAGNVSDRIGDALELENVLYGEVWLNNGQSNIEFEIQNATGGEAEIAAGNYPEIRYYKVVKAPVVNEELLEAEKSLKWKSFTDGDFRDVSAIGYYYAVRLYKQFGVPVGLVDCYLGGTSVTCWIDKESLSEMPEGRDYIDRFEDAVKDQTEENYQRELKEYNALVEEYVRKEQAAKKQNPNLNPEQLEAITGAYPWPPPVGFDSAYRPAGLIESMFKRVAPYTVKGIVYYQGEEDAQYNFKWLKKKVADDTALTDTVDGKHFKDEAVNDMYMKLLNRMIENYRKLYSDTELPVILVQLPMFIDRKVEESRDWGYLREAQWKVQNPADNIFLVPLIDLGDYDDIHPKEKKTPGNRVADAMLEYVYKDFGEYLFARPGAVKTCIEDGCCKVMIEAEGSFGGLKLMDNKLLDIRKEEEYSGEGPTDGRVYGFEVLVMKNKEGGYIAASDADEAGQIYAAEWVLPEKTFISQDTETPEIIIEDSRYIAALRYGFFCYGKMNLYNEKDMPMIPFRTCVRTK